MKNRSTLSGPIIIKNIKRHWQQLIGDMLRTSSLSKVQRPLVIEIYITSRSRRRTYMNSTHLKRVSRSTPAIPSKFANALLMIFYTNSRRNSAATPRMIQHWSSCRSISLHKHWQQNAPSSSSGTKSTSSLTTVFTSSTSTAVVLIFTTSVSRDKD